MCVPSQVGILEIAGIIHPGNPGQRFVTVLAYKFDESYKGSRAMVVAGWVGEERQWRRVRGRWVKAIAHENRTLPQGRKISRYHAAEMNANDGEYAGWNNESYRKLRFAKKLLKILGRSQMTAVACGIDLAAFLELFPHRDPPDYGVAYGMCMKVLMNELGHALDSELLDRQLALVHDHGDWDTLALNAYNQMVDDPKWKHRGRFVSITPLSSCSDIGLQCADLFAYESMRYLHDHDWTGGDMRVPLRELLKMNDNVFAIYLNRTYLENLEVLHRQGKLTTWEPRDSA